MIRSIHLAVAGGAVVLAAWHGPRAPGQRCQFWLLDAKRQLNKTSVFGTDKNSIYDVAGSVRMQCKGLGILLDADSVSVLSGDYARLFGHVVYRDSAYRFMADTMVYIVRTEKLEARGHVLIRDSAAGSTLVGPYVDYFRQVKGINDTARVVALGRPTVRYFSRPVPRDTVGRAPYILVGAHIYGFGKSRLSADSAATLDHDSVHAAADSMSFDQGKVGVARLVGTLAKVQRTGADSFLVLGREIRFRLEDDKLRELRTFLDATVRRRTTDIVGDTIVLSFDLEKLASTLAWGHKNQASLRSEGYDVSGDSLAVDTPGEELREVRVFGHGMLVDPRDTTLQFTPRFKGDSETTDTTRNTLWGEHVVARFGQVDSAGQRITRIRSLDAFGKGENRAKSLYLKVVTDDSGRKSPSINYTWADTIYLQMKGGDSSGVAAVRAISRVEGLQLTRSSSRDAKSPPAIKPGGGV